MGTFKIKLSCLLALFVLALPCTAEPAPEAPSAPPPNPFAALAAMVDTLPDDDIGLVARVHFATHTGDFDRSRAFYRNLGYTVTKPLPEAGTLQEARAYGLDEPFRVKGADIALVVPNLDRAVEIVKAQGVKFLSEVAPCCSGTGEDEFGIVHILDPDGVFLELVGPIAKREPQPQPEGCPPLEIKRRSG